MDQEGDKKSDAQSGNSGIGPDGVPWENRAKEYERKYNDLLTRLDDIEAKVTSDSKEEKVSKGSGTDVKQEKIAKFVDDPDIYIRNLMMQREIEKEKPEAIAWLHSQTGYDLSKDDFEITRVIKERNLSGSPKSVAKTAWDVVYKEKLENELKAYKEGRNLDVKSTPEGLGKSVPHNTGASRAEMLQKLKEVSSKGGAHTPETAQALADLFRTSK